MLPDRHFWQQPCYASHHPSIPKEKTQRQYQNPIAIELKGIVAAKEPGLLVLPITYIVHGKLSPSSIVNVIISILFLLQRKQRACHRSGRSRGQEEGGMSFTKVQRIRQCVCGGLILWSVEWISSLIYPVRTGHRCVDFLFFNVLDFFAS